MCFANTFGKLCSHTLTATLRLEIQPKVRSEYEGKESVITKSTILPTFIAMRRMIPKLAPGHGLTDTLDSEVFSEMQKLVAYSTAQLQELLIWFFLYIAWIYDASPITSV